MSVTTLASNRAATGIGLVPTGIGEAMQLAQLMADGSMLPQEFRGKPGNCLVVIEQAMRWQMSPFAVAMETSFISGKPMYSGKLVAAAVQIAPVLRTRMSYDYAGAGDDRTVTVSGTFHGEAAPRTIVLRLGDAKTSNAMWTKQPDQQLAYAGSRVWARRHAPEVMLGVYAPEEFDGPEPYAGTTINVRPEPTIRQPAREDAIPTLDDAPAKPDHARAWLDKVLAALAEVTDQVGYYGVVDKLNGAREKVKQQRPELERELVAALRAKYEVLMDRAVDAPADAPIPAGEA